MLFKKKILAPVSNNTQLIEVVQLWEVRWWSRDGEHLDKTPRYVSARQEVECFTSEEAAVGFKKALDQAFALLRYTGHGRDVTLHKGRSA